MGNRAKPTALKLLQGNPGKRKLNIDEPTSRRGAPEMPLFLNAIASQEWDRIIPILLDMNVLTIADGAALADYCMCFSRWQEAEAAVTKHGVVYEEPVTDEEGEVVGYRLKKNPAVTVAMACQKEMRAALGLFGLDPSSRSRIKGATQDKQKSALVQLLEANQARRQKARA
jgi:P27 family predicted phage terminase small subunit